MRPAASITRRSVLVGGALTLAGCRHASSRRTPPAASPDAAALAQARAGEAELIAAYDAAIASATTGDTSHLAAARGTHAAHLAALAGGSTPAVTTTPPPLSEIGALLGGSAASLRTFAVSAVNGHNAAVLASIAASHSVGSQNRVDARD